LIIRVVEDYRYGQRNLKDGSEHIMSYLDGINNRVVGIYVA